MILVRDNDGRKVDHKALEALRIRAVAQIRSGTRPADVAETLGLSRATIYGWLARYRGGGEEALRARPIPGRPPCISGDQVAQLWTLIIDADPRQWQFEPAFWQADLVRELMAHEFHLPVSTLTVRRLLRRMGVPMYEPRAGFVPAGSDSGAPARLRGGPRAGATYFVAVRELGLCLPSGPKAGISHSGQCRQMVTVTVVSAFNARVGPRFIACTGPVRSEVISGFCARLLGDLPGPVQLVMHGDPPIGEPSRPLLYPIASETARAPECGVAVSQTAQAQI